MADMIEMSRFYSQFQAARIKQDQKKRALDKLRKAVQEVSDEDTMLDLMEQIKVAEAEYKAASEEAESAWCLAQTGQPQQMVKAAQTVQWFTPWGHKISK